MFLLRLPGRSFTLGSLPARSQSPHRAMSINLPFRFKSSVGETEQTTRLDSAGMPVMPVPQTTSPDNRWRPADGIRFATSTAQSQAPTTQFPQFQALSSSFQAQTSWNSDDLADQVSTLAIAEDASVAKNKDESETAPKLPPPLIYQVPAEDLEEALSVRARGEPVWWSYSRYLNPEGETLPVHYCSKLDHSEKIAQLFLNQPLLGLDLEWKSHFRKTEGEKTIKELVSVIQLASPECIAIFHIALHEGTAATEIVPPTLKSILESDSVTKVGVWIAGDATRLHNFLKIKAVGNLELSHLHNLVKFAATPHLVKKRLSRLSVLCEQHLHFPLYKGAERVSDWTKELSEAQRAYAASDAYVAVRLYDVLNRKRLALPSVPPLPPFAELKLPVIALPASDCESESENDPDLESEVENDVHEDDTLSTSDISSSSSTSSTEQHSREVPPPTVLSDTNIAAIASARAWADAYISALPTTPTSAVSQPAPPTKSKTPTAASLRAYHLWHVQKLPVREIATLLRPPPRDPILEATVCSYIFNALRDARELPFDRRRLEDVYGGLNGITKGLWRNWRTLGR